MTPPFHAPLRVVSFRRPIPRTDEPDTIPPEAEPSAPPTREELVDDKIDALIGDHRDASLWMKRRARRTTRVLLGVGRVVRAVRATQLDEAEQRGRLAADVAKAIGSKLVGAQLKALGGFCATGLGTWFAAEPVAFVRFWSAVWHALPLVGN